VPDQFDVIVVGARCAGSPLATLLARAGMRVCLVDRAGFPSDTPSTHGIQPTGVKVLERLGVLDAVLEVTPPIERGTVVFDDARVEVDGVSERLGAPMLSTRRITLDAILLEAAAAAGVEIRPRTSVSGLVEEDGRIAGVKTAKGELRAPLVVGADGTRSTVAGLVGAAEYHATPQGRIFVWAYYEGATADDDRMWLGRVGNEGFLAFPTDADLFMAAVVISSEHREELRADRESGHATALSHWPELNACVEGARRVGPVLMLSRWHGYFRESAGPGWVLVGDAGHFKDPTPGQGIADALRQAECLAPAIGNALDGAGDQALYDWWAWRDRDAWEMYWYAHDMGDPGDAPPLLREIERRVASDPELTEALMRVLNHDLPPSKAFPPSLVLAAVSKVLMTRRGERRAVLRELRARLGNELRRRSSQPRGLPSPQVGGTAQSAWRPRRPSLAR
jgi:2-polyprenyl-6-methoxyphenol hydroxylase-like FAD-dependent oxidoreductase